MLVLYKFKLRNKYFNYLIIVTFFAIAAIFLHA